MGLDSVELVMEVENHFSISIPDAEVEKAYTVGKLVDCVAQIMGVKVYDFSYRENTFKQITEAILEIDSSIAQFPINTPVSKSLNRNDRSSWAQLEAKTNLKFPGLDTRVGDSKGFLPKLKNWFNFEESFDFENITWKKYTDITLATNLEKLSPPIQYKSKYEIYIAIMRITVDKSVSTTGKSELRNPLQMIWVSTRTAANMRLELWLEQNIF